MKKSVEKYFLKGTDEEVLFGDVIMTTLVKEFENGKKLTRNVEFVFNEATLPKALKLGAVEMRKEEVEKDNLIDFSDTWMEDSIEELLVLNEHLELKVEKLTEKVEKLEKVIEAIRTKK